MATLRRKSNGHLTQAAKEYLHCDWTGQDTNPRLKTWGADGKAVDAKQWVDGKKRKGVDKKTEQAKIAKFGSTQCLCGVGTTLLIPENPPL